MSSHSPIPSPPPELVEQWLSEFYGTTIAHGEAAIYLATKAAQWGADQELEACCEWLAYEGYEHEHLALRAARRPKPPSLKEQALADLDSMSIEPCLINGIDANALVRAKYDNIRRALEALDD